LASLTAIVFGERGMWAYFIFSLISASIATCFVVKYWKNIKIFLKRMNEPYENYNKKNQ
jgi:hypothetical protein